MANTYLNTGIASSNPQANINQVNNSMPDSLQAVKPDSLQASNNPRNLNNTINPITIPIQIQPQVTQTDTNTRPNTNLQTNNNVTSTPQTYNNNASNNVVDFNKIYSSYQSAYGTNPANTSSSGIKKTSIGTTIVTPTTSNLNSVAGQYQSAFADTINGLIGEMLNQMKTGFEYDPTTDNSLKVATEYAANSTLQSLAGSGVLNSSATAERVARIVSELIPQYEEKAHNRWIEYLGQLADTAQIVMSYDSQQFQYWKDAKDREFQDKEFEYKKSQDAIENAWRRVDELGYVDNKSSVVLGVKVGTLSKNAREAKEQREFEINKMKQQAEIEHANNVALTKLKNELDLQSSKTLADYQANIEKNIYKYKSNIDTKSSKELAKYNNSLSNSSKEYEYKLAQKYGSMSETNSNSSQVSLSTHKDIIKNNYLTTDNVTGETKVNNDSLYNYLQSEYISGRLSEKDLLSLKSMYNVTMPAVVSKSGNTLYVQHQGQTYTLTLTSNATKEQILNWGKNIGVDLSNYV